MARTLEQIEQELLNTAQARVIQLNEDNKRFQAIETAIKTLQLGQTAQTQFLTDLKEEVKTNQQAQVLRDKLVQGQLQELENKLLSYIVLQAETKPLSTLFFNLFKRK